MDKFIEALLDLIPFSAWFQKLGLSEKASDGLSVAAVALLVWLLGSGIKKLIERQKDLKASKYLYPQFDYQAVRQATRYYIPTHYQNASPARQDEPGFTHEYVARNPMIPFFIKTAFNKKADGERFYLILADSGMGKTTFMINLYIRYHSFFNRHKKHKMRLLRFSHPDTLTDIRGIKSEEAKNTILLLDALDEDPNIVSQDPNVTDAQAFQNRVDEIIEATRNFCEVVMTCRTQYFPGQEDNPYELKVKRPDEKGFFILNKLYLSPFNDKEVKRYLNKKYGYLRLWNRAKKRRAAQLVGQARHLVMRPMMLSYIDYLVGDNRSYQLDYDIYETLIEKWLIREARKRKHLVEEEAFVNNLRQVSQQTAIAIYQHWLSDKRLYLTREEAITIAEQNGVKLKPEEVTGQSLLTCDGLGHWKFAHKSILEFFLAKEALGNVEFFRTFIFTGMDMAKRFFEEKIPKNFVFVEGSSFIMGSSGEYTPHQVEVKSFCICKNQVTQAEYMEVTSKPNPSYFKGNDNNPVEQVSWLDAIEFCNLLNKKHGFLPTYDSEAKLLDSAGKVTNDITKVHGFRLPTEAEWEYAARGGSRSKGYEYSGSNDIKEVAWFKGNSGERTHPVGTLKPNELGIYDMSGNVWEWCYDWWSEKYYDECKGKGTVENPIGPESGRYRVVRGGSWGSDALDCRTADRNDVSPEDRYGAQGFRLVFVP